MKGRNNYMGYEFTKTEFLLPIEEIEESALKQFQIIDSKPWVIKAAAMPDAHSGKSEMPVGGVAITENIIAPEWVGVDIGCGVTFYDTGIPYDIFKLCCLDQLEHLDDNNNVLMSGAKGLSVAIKRIIPFGYNIRHTGEIGIFTSALGNKELDTLIRAKEVDALGTVGGGNHFVEFGITLTGTVGITIHTGSRNLGLTICNTYLKLGTHFKLDSELGDAYFEDMTFAINWAYDNRNMILHTVLYLLNSFKFPKPVTYDESKHIDIHHNYAEITCNGIIHRKGATAAYKDTHGIIPGNMEDGVFIVNGLGNETYLNTCSHGAGRKMSRSAAFKTLNYNDFETSMKKSGVYTEMCESILDESKEAYKDIYKIIELQDGKVFNVVNYVKPFCCIKDTTPNKRYRKKK